jgi:hypothetical protein
VTFGNLHPPKASEWERCKRCGDPTNPLVLGDSVCRCGMRRVGQRRDVTHGTPAIAALAHKATAHMKLEEDKPIGGGQ